MMKRTAAVASRLFMAFFALSAILAVTLLPVSSVPLGVSEAPAASASGESSPLLFSELPPLSFYADPVKISGLTDGSVATQLYGEKEELDLSPFVPPVENEDEYRYGLFPCPYVPTPEEYDMILFCVDHETRSGSLKHRILITQVIMNRVIGPKFGSTVSEVLLKPGQFDVMPWYEDRGDWVPKEITREAVNLVLSGLAPNYANGAVYFCNPYIVGEGNWFDSTLQVVCELEGHRFYKPY